MKVLKTNLLFDKTLSFALIVDVKNAADIRQQLLAGNLQCAIIKPSLIIDVFQICVASNKALLAKSLGKLLTKSVYTELIFNLSINKGISQSLIQFGITNTDTELIVISFGDDSDMSQIISNINGHIVDMNTLPKWSDETAIKKAYKINHEETSVSNLLDIIVSKISTKDFMSH